MLTLESFAAEYRPHHNEMCMAFDDKLCRLVGVGIDDDDAYYIVRERHERAPQFLATATDDFTRYSAVGHLQSLKDIYPADAYAQMDKVAAMNGCPETSQFIVEDLRIIDEEASHGYTRITKCGRFRLDFDETRPELRFSLWRRYPNTFGAEDAFLIRGEFGPLMDIMTRMVREADDWTEQQALAAGSPSIDTHEEGSTPC